MATLREIGESLGLSPATVSRALNGFSDVSEKTRARVVEAARRLDYSPNQIAQKLVSGRSGIVGLVIKKPRALANDPTFFGVVTGISASLALHGIDLMLQVGVDDDEVAPYKRLLAKGTLDGFILKAPRPNDPRITFLKEKGARFVVHGRSGPEADYPYYDIDNHQVSALPAGMLCDLGHSRIALINGPAEHAYTTERCQGLINTLVQRELPPTPARFVMHGPLSESHGYVSALKALSGTLGVRPTAFLCASTWTAVGVLRAIADKGLRIPEDVSVVAHDDDVPGLPIAGFVPTLTATRSPLTDASTHLAEILLAAIEGKQPELGLQRRIQPEFRIGRSTGPVSTHEAASW